MPVWCTSCTLYKGLFILVFFLIALEYLFGSITETRHFFVYNATRIPHHQERMGQHSALLKTLLFKNNKLSSPPASNSRYNSTNVHVGGTPAAKYPAAPDANATSISQDLRPPPHHHPHPLTPQLLAAANATMATVFDAHDSYYYPDPEAAVAATRSTQLQVGGGVNGTTTGRPPLCPEVPSNLLGRIQVSTSPVPTVQQLEKKFSWLHPGGHWAPDTCRTLKKVALIIPFRCRGEHILLFLQHMHPFLRRQQLDYTIFIVEQDGNGPFNRAMLMNIGYTQALKMRDFDCFIFHDIDLLPEDDRNLYNCPPGQPRHMSVAIDIFKYKLPYPAIFGGVSAISREHFKLLNGFSNSFWGWGGEDDDMANRIRYHNLYISRYPLTIARYTMLTHKKDKPSPNRYDVLKQGQKRFDKDGLNSLKYKLLQNKKNLLYTWLLVSIEAPS